MTATTLVREQIERFLSTSEPEVLCISGNWGVGKTYLWDQSLEKVRSRKATGLKRYTYVSLFGVGLLSDLKLAMFEGTIELIDDDTKSLRKRWSEWAKRNRGVAEALPNIGDYLKAAGPLFYSQVKNQIVCIDDIERRSSTLTIKDVMGLVSSLKEERRCKVVILLNDLVFDGDEREDFANYFEKVVDTHLRFDPSAADSVHICLKQDDTIGSALSERCISLGISNIRVIRKVERFARDVAKILAGIDPAVLDQAIHSITLLGWSHFDKANAPSKGYIKDRNSLPAPKQDDEPLDPKVAAWNALLDNYKFGAMDEFDRELLKSIEAGYFDTVRVLEHAQRLQEEVQLRRQDGDFQAAWDIYHDSLENNEEEVVSTISTSFKKTFKTISPINLDGTVRLLRELGRDQEADELLRFYMNNRREPRAFWDLDDYLFEDSVKDPAVREAFRTKFEKVRGDYNLGDVLERIGTSNGWNPEEMDAISSMSVEEYYRLFKRLRGRNLRRAINAALLSNRTANASDSMREVTVRAKEALTRIAAESRINARRLAQFGVKPRTNR